MTLTRGAHVPVSVIGQRFGLVTITEVKSDGRRNIWFGVCMCGRGRWFRPPNLRRHPPKTHRVCLHGAQLELPLDDVQQAAHKDV